MLDKLVEICAWRGCGSASSDDHGFCANHFDLLFKAIESQFKEVLGVADRVYLGRSSHPERRLLEHFDKKDLNYLLVVHWAANWLEIQRFEERIIVQNKEKYNRVENKSDKSEGSYFGAWTALYISFSLKHGIKRIPGASEIKQLFWRHRLWPDPILPNSPVLLRCDLTKEKARAEVDRFKEENARHQGK